MKVRDLCILGAASGAWLGAALAAAIPQRWIAIAVAAVALSIAAHTVVTRRSRLVGWSAVLVVTMLAAAAGVFVAAARQSADARSPIHAVASASDTSAATLRITDDPRPRRDGSGDIASPSADVIVRAQVTALVVDDRRVSVRAPIIVIAPSSWAQVPVGSTVDTTVAWSPAESGDIAAFGRVRSAPTVTAGPSTLIAWANSIRAGLREAAAPVGGDGARLVPALVLGDESAVPESVTDDLRGSGLAHLSAVSGANVAFVLLAVLLILRWCGVRGIALTAAGLLTIAGFAVVARLEPSVLRASVMASVVLLATVRGGSMRALPALGSSVVLLILIDPALAITPGFLLSVAATAGLVTLVPILGASRGASASTDPPTLRARRVVAAALATTVAAQLAVAPILAALSGQLEVGGVVANVLAAPAVPPVTIVGFLAAMVAPIHGGVATVLAHVAAVPATWIVWVAEQVAAHRWSQLPWPGGAAGAFALLVLLSVAGFGLVAVIRSGRSGQRRPRSGASSLRGARAARRPPLLLVVAMALALVVVVVAPVNAERRWPPEGWLVAMCDVGQGDATVLNAGEGHAIVVDAGPDSREADRCLRDLGIAAIPLVVLTHFHADHVVGLPGVVRGRTVDRILTTNVLDPAAAAASVDLLARRRSIPTSAARPGATAMVGGWQLTVLGPTTADAGEGSVPNNASVVVLAERDGVRVLLLGDVEVRAQEQLLAVAGPAVSDIDVVKVAHHGSAVQVPALLDRAQPTLALIGVGCDNTYGHPSAVTLTALQRVGAAVGRTDRDGDLAVIRTDRPWGAGVGLIARGAAATHGPASRC